MRSTAGEAEDEKSRRRLGRHGDAGQESQADGGPTWIEEGGGRGGRVGGIASVESPPWNRGAAPSTQSDAKPGRRSARRAVHWSAAPAQEGRGLEKVSTPCWRAGLVGGQNSSTTASLRVSLLPTVGTAEKLPANGQLGPSTGSSTSSKRYYARIAVNFPATTFQPFNSE